MSSIDQMSVKVTAIEQVAPMIKAFTLQPLEGQLTPFSAGAHVVVEMGEGEQRYRNAYSLMSNPNDNRQYQIAVRLQEASRGGSIYMHEQVAVGDELKISPPANLFAPAWKANKHVLFAGGVGITPFLSYVPVMQQREAEFELHYMYRSQQTGAYSAELTEQLGDACRCYDADQGSRCDIAAVMADQPLGTHFYICGPESLIEAVRATADELGIPAGAIHWEEFAGAKPGQPFKVELSRSGVELAVAADTSLLEALEAADIDIQHLCRAGVCGQCVCDVTEGEIEHRDSYLSDAEKQSGKQMMPCVSRAAGERLVLDI
ncbi:PDR/VanB family oxidoreductase [Amphritea sp. 1_MG-2023]|uniref:PDR/VanB family oxidoreductase n=1 Tax=Amphritea sp. 1_MG-2023 TaxID=3062670 RepID=UPI0026E45519|nr:PDR/VanB family oxidoreductase [Amphritea sp. 1_MG-2023]MDO6564506.1 PDR/VanB family oxidoreductase [Amphritea sp. 1_MG-2023]